MSAKPRRLIAAGLLSTLLLASASSVLARDIIVEFVPATVSSLGVAVDGNDTILVRRGGSLLVDSSATIASLTIGDSTSAATVAFPESATLTVKGNVVFGSDAGNMLDMSVYGTTTTLKVGGGFLLSGVGTFKAGAGTIEYNGTSAQTITANIGGGGAIIQYKDLVLSGNPETGTAPKNFASGVSVQGRLTVKEKAAPSGGSVNYGSLGSLLYSSTVAQVSTPTEWPASANISVTIDNPAGLTLDGNKTLGAVFPNSLVLQSAATVLNDNGKTLTVLGNVSNAGSIRGAGVLVLSGTGAQVLSGSGNYGNVTVNNIHASGVSLPGSNPTVQPTIMGRLTIAAGKVNLPTGTAHQASLLTFSGSDKAAGEYTAANSGTAFMGTGTLTVLAKPTAAVAYTSTNNIVIAYGDSSVTIIGTVKPPTTTPNFADFGNTAVNGEQVTVTVLSGVTTIATVTGSIVNSGAYSITLNTATLAANAYTVRIAYAGGINLVGRTIDGPPLTVSPKVITVVPRPVAKTYGSADPQLLYDYAPPLIGSDVFFGGLTRQAGENAGDYTINIGTLTLDAGRYSINFANSNKFRINQKPITITVDSKTKVYGDGDPVLTYTPSAPLFPGDSFDGALSRASGETVGTYAINKGSLRILPGDNYAMTLTAADLVINKKPVTVTFNSVSKTYGETDPAFTWNTSPGLAFSDSWNNNLAQNPGKPSRVSGDTVAGSPYTIQQGTLAILQGTNYTVTWTDTGKLTINKKQVAVEAITQNKEYGAAMPSLVKYTGFVGSQKVPATPNTITWGTSKGQATSCSIPAAYDFTVNNDAQDPNHSFAAAGPGAGILNVTKAQLTVTAENKSKVANDAIFDKTGFTVRYNNFVCSDSAANAFDDLTKLDYTGAALTAKDPGVYQITPQGLTSSKYNITYASGWLSISTKPGTNSVADPVWQPGGSQAFMFSHANGQPGMESGWTLIKTSGQLSINATEADKFRIDLVTVQGNASARMTKFDPTRGYKWEIVQAAGGISGFTSANQFTFNFDGGGYLFSNPVFGGKFSVEVGNGNKSLYLVYIPVGAPGNPIPANYNVGTVADTSTLLGDVTHSDVDALYLSASATEIRPQDKVTININVANLKQPVVGAEVYINFDSRFFVASATGSSAPVVAAGGGVWDTVIYNKWNTSGDLDTVLAINLSSAVGTSDDAVIGKVTLTPTKTATGKSRVIFRQDGGTRLDGGVLVTTIQPAQSLAPAILPARVMSPEILINVDDQPPVFTSFAATQTQPYVGTVNVKNGSAADRTQVVKPGGSGTTTSGKVIIVAGVRDDGVGMSGAPTLTLTKSGSSTITVASTASGSGTYTYEWNPSASTANGTWTANFVAKDLLNPGANTTTTNAAFTMDLNTTEVNGIVELQNFIGTNRNVVFSAGDDDSATTNDLKTWNISLNLMSGDILAAGAFQNRQSFVDKVKSPPSSHEVAQWLRYGDMTDVAPIATSIKNMTRNVDMYLHDLLYGYISDLNGITATLINENRAVDVYINDQLSASTIAAIAAYDPAKGTGADAASEGILLDFTKIISVNSTSRGIYEPVRFASVSLSTQSSDLLAQINTILAASAPNNVPPASLVRDFNRSLLKDTYPQYMVGVLDPATANRLTGYTSGSDATLVAGLLTAFDTMTLDSFSANWPTATPPYVQCLYNEQIFLEVPLASATRTKLQSNPTGNDLVVLNQMLLVDAYIGYQRAPLTPACVNAAKAFAAGDAATVSAFDSVARTDLNVVINGARIYNTNRFADYIGGIDPNSELGMLIALPSRNATQQKRENRLLLELAYTSELSKGILAPYRLVQVPAGTKEITAKTSWNLRKRTAITPATDVTVNFVNDGVSGWGSADASLRAGDITGDNIVDLSDYNVLRINYGSAAASAADIDGEGSVNINDYSLIRANWQKSGDADVK